MDDELGASLRAALAHHLRGKQFPSEDDGERLNVGVGAYSLAISSSLYARESRPGSVMTEIEVTTRLSPANWGSVVQYNVGVADTEAGALAEAVHGWLDGVWPVLVALYDSATLSVIGRPAMLETVTGSEHLKWRVLTGEPRIRANPDQVPELERRLRKNRPLTLMGNAMADAVNQNRLIKDGSPNWGHIFAMRSDQHPAAHEATIRGEPWHEAVRDLVLNFPWPDSPKPMAFRQFFVIQRVI